MNNKILILCTLLLAGCGDKERLNIYHGRDGIDGIDGQDGSNGVDGKDGANGHSLVSEYVNLSEESLECDANGGSSLDIYIDMDDSLSVSEGDLYSNSLVACNGANGLNGQDGRDGYDGATGEQGPQGEAGPQGEPGIGLPGPVGPQGATGAQGPAGAGATVSSLTASSCTRIGDSDYYQKSGYLYDDNDCHSSDKIELQTGESIIVDLSPVSLVVKSSSGLRLVTFN